MLSRGFELTGGFRSSGIDRKPPKDLTCETTKPTTSAKPMVVNEGLPAEQTPQTTSPNKNRQAYVTTDNEDSDDATIQDSKALAEALAASSDVTQGEVECIIEDAIRQMNPSQNDSRPQERPASPDQPPSKGSILKSGRSNKRKHSEPIKFGPGAASHRKFQYSTEARAAGDKAAAGGARLVKRPKLVNTISDAYRVSKPKDAWLQMNNKPATPGHKGFAPAQLSDCTVPQSTGVAQSEAAALSSTADVQSSSDVTALSKQLQGDHMNTRPAPPMLLSTQSPACKDSHLTQPDIGAKTLPPSRDELLDVRSDGHEISDVVEPPNAMDTQDPDLEALAAASADNTSRARGDREISQTLEPEAIEEKTAPEKSPAQSNEAATPIRKSRIAVQLWILEARTPRVAWRQWANASLNAQTVTTIFQTVDELSQFRNVDTAHVRFQTDEQVWTYTIRKDDADHFEDMKRSITADIKATNRRNRNNNNDFKIFIEPVAAAETAGDEAMDEAEDEIILGLY